MTNNQYIARENFNPYATMQLTPKISNTDQYSSEDSWEYITNVQDSITSLEF